MSISRYEELKKEAIKAIHHAICENNYYCKDEYLIAIQNVTDGYNVDFTHTVEGDWADDVFEQDCDVAIECAYNHKDSMYITILAKSYLNGSIELFKDARFCIKSRTK